MLFRRITLLAVACLVTCLGSATAQDGVPQSDQDACRPDVFRLCASEIPDGTDIVACLNAKVAGLSPQCRAVIAPEANAARRRAARP